MRVTQSRYEGELERFHLAIRMLILQARTSTIRRYTGLSSDRIRKAYVSYVAEHGKNRLPRRKRGRPPSRVAHFFKSHDRHCESTVLVSLFMHAGLLVPDGSSGCKLPAGLSLLSQGHRLCDAYEMHRQMVPGGEMTLELAATLLRALAETQELALAECECCGALYVHDAYALDYGRGPFCEQPVPGGPARITCR
ncbi:MAG: hypothetical protein OXC70_06370 [Gammaproteobacteria bacterium]|nr:hypothetical protein [Gammaproteobacteria bacterium]